MDMDMEEKQNPHEAKFCFKGVDMTDGTGKKNFAIGDENIIISVNVLRCGQCDRRFAACMAIGNRLFDVKECLSCPFCGYYMKKENSEHK